MVKAGPHENLLESICGYMIVIMIAEGLANIFTSIIMLTDHLPGNKTL